MIIVRSLYNKISVMRCVGNFLFGDLARFGVWVGWVGTGEGVISGEELFWGWQLGVGGDLGFVMKWQCFG